MNITFYPARDAINERAACREVRIVVSETNYQEQLDIKTIINVTSDFTNNEVELCTLAKCEYQNLIDDCSINLSFELSQTLQSRNSTTFLHFSLKMGPAQVLTMAGGTKLTINQKEIYEKRQLQIDDQQQEQYLMTDREKRSLYVIKEYPTPKDIWGFQYKCWEYCEVKCCICNKCDDKVVWTFAAPYFYNITPPGINVVLGFSGSVQMGTLYNPGNLPMTFSASEPGGHVTNSGFDVTFTVGPLEWDQLGPRAFTSVINGQKGVREQVWGAFNVINTPPQFTSAIVNQQLNVNETISYQLPGSADESGHFFTFSQSPLETWMAFDAAKQIYTFTPTKFPHVGAWPIGLTLTDQTTFSTVTLTVTVINRPPIYDLPGQTYLPVTLHLNFKDKVKIPIFHDPDGSDSFAGIYDTFAAPIVWSVLPDFSEVILEPVAFSEVGVHTAYVRLYDEGKAETLDLIMITVINDVPIFQFSPLPTMTAPMNISTDETYTVFLFDTENHLIELTPWQHDASLNLVPPPYFVTQDIPKSHTITVKALSFDDIGEHKVQIKINDGGVGFNTMELIINITNWAPYFVDNAKLLNHSIKMNNSYNYQLPKYKDRENNPVQLFMACVPSVIDWAWVTTEDSIYFNPTKWNQMGHYECVLTLADARNASYHSFYVNVVNFPPMFASGQKPKNVKMNINKVKEVEMPTMIDTENNPILIIQTLPNFIKYEDGKYIFSPTDPAYHLGFFIIRGEITDTMLSTPFKFSLNVVNEPPDFEFAPMNQIAYIGMKTDYTLPQAIDPEGLKFTVTMTQEDGSKAPPYIKHSKGVLYFNIPDDPALEKTQIKLKFKLDDGFSRAKERFVKVSIDPPESLAGMKGANIAKIKILSVTRDQMMTIKIIGEKGSQKLVQKFSPDSFKIRVKSTNEQVTYNITVRSSTQGQVTFRLGFKDMKKISSSTVLDEIEIKLKQEVSLHLSDLGKLIYLPCCIPESMKIPPQIDEQSSSAVKKLQKSAQTISQAGLTFGLILNVFMSMFIQYLWGLLNDLSFLTICSMISINVPGIGKMVQSILLSFIYLDILQTELWLFPLLFPPKPYGEEDEMDGALNDYFDENGFSSKTLIKNLGSTFVYLAIYLVMILLIPIFNFLGKRLAILSRFSAWLSKQLLWNAVIRFILQQAPPLMNAAGINSLNLRFSGDLGTIMSSVLTILVTLVVVASIFIFSKILKIQRLSKQDYNSTEFSEKFGTLTQGLNTGTAIGVYWNVLVLVRWLYTTLVLIFLRDNSEFQIFSLLISSVLFQCLLIYGKPMPSSNENIVSVFNEFMVSLYLYAMINLTDFFGENYHREKTGYVLVGIVLASVLINVLKFFILVSREIISKYKRWRREKGEKIWNDYIKKHPQTLDVHQARTLVETSGIFAYSNDIVGKNTKYIPEELQREGNEDVPKVMGPIGQYMNSLQLKAPNKKEHEDNFSRLSQINELSIPQEAVTVPNYTMSQESRGAGAFNSQFRLRHQNDLHNADLINIQEKSLLEIFRDQMPQNKKNALGETFGSKPAYNMNQHYQQYPGINDNLNWRQNIIPLQRPQLQFSQQPDRSRSPLRYGATQQNSLVEQYQNYVWK